MSNLFTRKFITAAAWVALGFLVITGCKPGQSVDPEKKNPTLAAFGDTVHEDPAPICGTPVAGDLVDAQGRTGTGSFFGPDIYGTWRLISTPTEMVLQVTLTRGWQCSDYAVYMGSLSTMPLNSQNNPDYENFPINGLVRPVKNIWETRWPINQDMRCPNSVWNAIRLNICEIDFIGNPYNCVYVWLGNPSSSGQPVGTDGGVAVSYCAETCDTTPPCSVPVLGPGADLSDYRCGNGNGQTKVTVCHIPPGNPANMQEICIAVPALPAHIQEFKPVNNPCMGHHSGCHIGPCDPCGPGSTADYLAGYTDPCPGNGGNGGNNGNGNGNGGNNGNGNGRNR